MTIEETDTNPILVTIRKHDVEWEMDWSKTNAKEMGLRTTEPYIEAHFEEGPALAVLLAKEVININEHHWKSTWPDDAKKTIYMGVNCNDIFAWGCSDSEEMLYEDIEEVYQHWKKDPIWGSAVWCMIRRKELPQTAVAGRIKAQGIWDLDALAIEYNLRVNHYSGVNMVMARHKHGIYSEWAESRGETLLPFDKHWWIGWNAYTEAVPDWNSEAFKFEEDRRRAVFRAENGFAD